MITELDELQSLRDEISTLKEKVKSLENKDIPTIQSNPGGTVAALSTLLLDPAYPRISFGPNAPAGTFPAQFKFEMAGGGPNPDILNIYFKSQFSANSDWEQAIAVGVAGQPTLFKTVFINNHLKFNPSGSGEGNMGVDFAPFGTNLQGLIITGVIHNVTGGQTAPIIVLDGVVQQVGMGFQLFATEGAIAGAGPYLNIIAPSGGVTSPVIQSVSGKINIADLVTGNVTASQLIKASDLQSTGNAEISNTLFSAGLNVSNPAAITFGSNWQSWTPTITADQGMVSGVTIYNGAYLRVGPITFLTIRWGMTLSAQAGFIYLTLPVAGPAAPNNFASMGSVLVETSPGNALNNQNLHLRFMNPGTQMVINEPSGFNFGSGSGWLMSGFGFYRSS